MRVPLSWLRELVDWPWPPEELAARLTGVGLAVEAVERTQVSVERIDALEPLPGSDHLRVCRLRGGATVVSGAPDLDVGRSVAWARPGAVLPDGRRIEPATFLGVASEGMLCSALELGLPADGTGLLAIEDPRLAAALDDTVLVLELTPNYAVHCQSLLGVAREVAALAGETLHLPAAEVPEVSRPTAARATVAVDCPDLCPRYVARVMEGLADGPSPAWLARRLQLAGMRPVSAIVDATNYVMLESGQPLHAFDLALLDGGVVVRRASPGEAIVTLDGTARSLAGDDLVIATGGRPVALAGVMGSRDSEVGPETRAILLEAAVFTADAVARTARRHGIRSEAAARFARGVDAENPRWAADRALRLIREACGGQVLSGAVESGGPPPRTSVGLRGATVRSLLGVSLSTTESGRILRRLGFGIAADGADRLRVTVPPWRGDVALEVDLVEEIARVYGYDRIPSRLPPGPSEAPSPDPLAPIVAAVRSCVLAAGFSEAITYAFHGRAAWDRLRLPADHPWRQAVPVANPMSEEQAVLRPSLAVGLIEALGYGARHRQGELALAEIGRVFGADADAETGVAERLVLGMGGYGRLGAGWSTPGVPLDFFAVKGVVEEIAARLGFGAIDARRAADLPFLHPGRCARLFCGGRPAGWLGELHPQVAAAWDLPPRPVLGQLEIGVLSETATLVPAFSPWTRWPSVRRDLAFVLPDAVAAADALRVVREAAGPCLARVELFDVFTGEGVPAGSRSLAVSLVYEADRSLTDAEVERWQEAVRTRLAALGAVLRS